MRSAGRLRVRELARPVAEVGEAGLQVQRRRVVGLGADAARGQVLDQRVPALDLDQVDVADRVGLRPARRPRSAAAARRARPAAARCTRRRARPGGRCPGPAGSAWPSGRRPAGRPSCCWCRRRRTGWRCRRSGRWSCPSRPWWRSTPACSATSGSSVRIMPASPSAPSVLVGKKDSTPPAPSRPACRPSQRMPIASALSSTTVRPCRRASSPSAAMSAIWWNRCTGITRPGPVGHRRPPREAGSSA